MLKDIQKLIELCTIGRNANGAAAMENSMEFLQTLKIKLSYHSSTPLVCGYPKELKARFLRDICTPMFVAALFILAMIWKQLHVH